MIIKMKIDEVLKDVQRQPEKYVGCPLCFGKGFICEKISTDGGILCPECEGMGIIISSNYMED